jgi:hypothetical protein
LVAVGQCRRYLDHLMRIRAIDAQTPIYPPTIKLQVGVGTMPPIGPESVHAYTTLMDASHVSGQWFWTSANDITFEEVELDWFGNTKHTLSGVTTLPAERPSVLIRRTNRGSDARPVVPYPQALAMPLGSNPYLHVTRDGVGVGYEKPPLSDPTVAERQHEWMKDWRKVDQRLKNYPTERRTALTFLARARTNRSEFQISTPSFGLFGGE